MKNLFYRIFLFTAVLLTSCSDESGNIEPVKEGTEITKFYFLKSDNGNLPYDIYLDIEDKYISERMPLGIDVNKLVATFEHNGFEVLVNNTKQVSGTTKNDFSD